MIEEYRFGSITINGKTYNHDVEVRWTGKVLKWWRRESHIIDVDDVKRATEQNPNSIIIGTGAYGAAKVTKEAQNFIKDYDPPATLPLAKGERAPKGIKLIIDKTEEAVKTFNIILKESELEEGKQNKIIGLFHLTC